MAYGGFKNSPRRGACDKLLRDKAFDIAKNPIYDRNQRGLAAMVYKFATQMATNTGTGIDSK